AALALLELDGVARRLVLCPPGLPGEAFPSIVESAGIDTVVTGREERAFLSPSGLRHVECETRIESANVKRAASRETEWVLFTAGTTGLPKMVVHTLKSLTGAIMPGGAPNASAVWGTFYDMRRYGGLQIFLRAMLGNHSFILSSANEPLNCQLDR